MESISLLVVKARHNELLREAQIARKGKLVRRNRKSDSLAKRLQSYLTPHK